MKKATIGLGAIVVALAGGVMFCSDAFEDEPMDTIAQNDQNTNAPGDTPSEDTEEAGDLKPWKLDATVMTGDSPRPSFVAFKDGDNGWRHPTIDGPTISLEVYDPKQRYSILTACDYEDAKGQRHVDLTLMEATVAEVQTPRMICRTHSEEKRDVQLAGAVRNTDGQDVQVKIGSRVLNVENDKDAEGVLFATNVASGRHTIVARQGYGEKAVIAAARGQELRDPSNTVEIDLNDSIQIVPTDISTYGNGVTYFAGGNVHLWLDGRTPLSVGPLTGEMGDGGPVLHMRSTQEPRDVLDLTAHFRNLMPFWGTDPAVVADVRHLTTADASRELLTPGFDWVESSEVRFHDRGIDIGWKTANWSVFGYTRDHDLALFMPTAYVARVTQTTNARRRLDLVVTPARLSGPNPMYTIPEFNEIEHFEAEWGFRPSADMIVKAGNLTAYSGGEKVFGGEAISNYLETGSVHGPAGGISTRSLTTIVTGLPVEFVDETTEMPALRREVCATAQACIDKVSANPLAVEECGQLETYRACEAAEQGPEFKASAETFATDLKQEIVRWYALQDVTIPNAIPKKDALAKITAENVKTMKPLEFGEWHSFDPGSYQVFFMVDPTREDSQAIWYGAYLFGNLVDIYAINFDYETKEIDFPALMDDLNLPVEEEEPTTQHDPLVTDLLSLDEQLDIIRSGSFSGK